MTQSIIEKKHQWGGGTNVKLKLLGGLYTKRANSVHGLCNLLSLHCQEGAKIWKVWGTPAPSMKLYWCVGSLGMCTLLLVCTGMWLVENMSWVCMLMGGHIVAYAGSVHSCWGGGGGVVIDVLGE